MEVEVCSGEVEWGLVEELGCEVKCSDGPAGVCQTEQEEGVS